MYLDDSLLKSLFVHHKLYSVVLMPYRNLLSQNKSLIDYLKYLMYLDDSLLEFLFVQYKLYSVVLKPCYNRLNQNNNLLN